MNLAQLAAAPSVCLPGSQKQILNLSEGAIAAPFRQMAYVSPHKANEHPSDARLRLSKKSQKYRRAAALRLSIRNQRRVRWFRNPCVARVPIAVCRPGSRRLLGKRCKVVKKDAVGEFFDELRPPAGVFFFTVCPCVFCRLSVQSLRPFRRNSGMARQRSLPPGARFAPPCCPQNAHRC